MSLIYILFFVISKTKTFVLFSLKLFNVYIEFEILLCFHDFGATKYDREEPECKRDQDSTWTVNHMKW
jgi:hypothetical protein